MEANRDEQLITAATTIGRLLGIDLGKLHDTTLTATAEQPDRPYSDALLMALYELAPASPPAPDVVGMAEVGEILGVSRARAAKIAETDGAFPAPVYDLAAGKLWARAAIVAYAPTRNTKGGRPRKATDEDRSGE
uniref:hypothetical protein n=1 Tax=Herbidospora sakaeratensis TaxID=564415 RepID=UPI000781E8F0|nr:hypothetical protein [Herbidospora sakaeratensis]